MKTIRFWGYSLFLPYAFHLELKGKYLLLLNRKPNLFQKWLMKDIVKKYGIIDTNGAELLNDFTICFNNKDWNGFNSLWRYRKGLPLIVVEFIRSITYKMSLDNVH